MEENKCEVCGNVFDTKAELMKHAKVHIGVMKNNLRTGKVVISSIIGGIVGGILMLIVLMAGAAGMGLPSTTFALIMGMGLGATMGSAEMVGVLGHFIVSIVAGAIFGALVSYVKPLRLGKAPRSLALGLIYGIVIYLVFFLPMAMTVFASVMMKLMGAKAAMMLPDVLVIGLIGHIVYGLTLGAITLYVGKIL